MANEEKLTDGGLEEWLGPEDLTHWTEYDDEIFGKVEREGEIVHGGSLSASLYTKESGDYAGFYQNFSLTPGAACKIIFWYIRTAHDWSKLRIHIRDETEVNIGLDINGEWGDANNYFDLPVAEIWTKFELEFTAHADYENYRIRIHKSQSGGIPATFYIDDLSILDVYEEEGSGGGGEEGEESKTRPLPVFLHGIKLPVLEWLSGDLPSWPVSTNKEIEVATMMDKSRRVAFFGTRKIFELDYPYLSSEWLEIFKGLHALKQNLTFKNTAEDNIEYNVVISMFSYEPARMDIRQLNRYKVKLVLEETDYRKRA